MIGSEFLNNINKYLAHSSKAKTSGHYILDERKKAVLDQGNILVSLAGPSTSEKIENVIFLLARLAINRKQSLAHLKFVNFCIYKYPAIARQFDDGKSFEQIQKEYADLDHDDKKFLNDYIVKYFKSNICTEQAFAFFSHFFINKPLNRLIAEIKRADDISSPVIEEEVLLSSSVSGTLTPAYNSKGIKREESSSSSPSCSSRDLEAPQSPKRFRKD